MQEFHSMRKEHGSALVGVIAITVILTISASGFLFNIGNFAKDSQVSAADQTLHSGAESAMMMGARWVRASKYSDITTDWAGEFVITKVAGVEYLDIEGIQARLSIWCIPGGKRLLKCIATKGPNKDVLTIQWTLDHVTGDSNGKCIPSFSGWQETYTPGIP